MTPYERQILVFAAAGMTFISLIHAMLKTPFSSGEAIFWVSLSALWFIMRISPLYRAWSSSAKQFNQAALYVLVLGVILYFGARFVVSPFIALGGVLLFTVYFSIVYLAVPLLIALERYDAAHQWISVLLKFFPRSSRLYLQEGYLFLQENAYEKALTAATTALDLQPMGQKNARRKSLTASSAVVQAHLLQTVALLRLQALDDALQGAEWLVRMLPLDPQGYSYRILIHLSLGDVEAANADINHLKTMTLAPGQTLLVHNYEGLAAHVSGQYAKAVEHYLEAIQTPIAPGERKDYLPVPYVGMAITQFTNGDMQAAWQAVRTAQQIDPTSVYALSTQAVLHAAEGQWDEAINLWRTLVVKDQHFADAGYIGARYFRWSPKMVELVNQIVTHLEPTFA